MLRYQGGADGRSAADRQSRLRPRPQPGARAAAGAAGRLPLDRAVEQRGAALRRRRHAAGSTALARAHARRGGGPAAFRARGRSTTTDEETMTMPDVTRTIARPQDRLGGDDPLPRREWLVTNGLGGYASGTVAGVVTRRYHGLLIASLPAPLGRMVMLNHLLERVRLPDRRRAVARRRGRGRRPERRRSRRAPGRVPARARPAGLAVRSCAASTIEKRVLMPHGQNTVHVTYRLLDGDGPGAADAAAVGPVPRLRGAGRRVAGARPTRSTRRERPLRAVGGPRSAAAAAAAARRSRRADARREGRAGRAVRDGAEPRLRVGRLAVEPRLFPRRSAPGRRRSRWSRRPSRGTRFRRCTPRGARRAERERRRAAARDRRARRRGSARRRAGARGRSVHHHAGRPRRGSGARARRRRRGAHGDRRLSLVHRLGPRHDDQPRRADADDRPVPRGRLHPADVRALRPRRPDPEHVSRGRARGAVSHRRRDAVVLPRARALRRVSPATPTTLRQLLPNARRHRRSTICAARGSASASIRPTACCGRARRAIS